MPGTLAIVTGASRGLGEALALGYIARGIPLVTVARSRSARLDDAANQADTPVTQIQADLSDPAVAGQTAEKVATLIPGNLKRCILVNNAGTVQPIANTRRLTDAGAISAALTLNITSLMLISSAALNAVQTNTDCRILNISSGAGRNPMPGWGVYCATKAAVDIYSRVLAQEHPGVRIVSLAPGVIDTPMQQAIRASDQDDFPNVERFQDMHRQGQLASPADTARHIIQYIERDDFGTTVLDDIRNYF